MEMKKREASQRIPKCLALITEWMVVLLTELGKTRKWPRLFVRGAGVGTEFGLRHFKFERLMRCTRGGTK